MLELGAHVARCSHTAVPVRPQGREGRFPTRPRVRLAGIDGVSCFLFSALLS